MRISLYTQQWNVYITNQLSILFAVFSGNQVGCLHLCVPATGHKLVALSFGTHRCLALDFQRGRLIAARIIFLNFQCPAPQLLATLGNWEVPCNIPASWASSFLCGPSLAIVSSSPWCLVFLALPHSPCFLLPSSLLLSELFRCPLAAASGCACSWQPGEFSALWCSQLILLELHHKQARKPFRKAFLRPKAATREPSRTEEVL